MAMVKLVRFVLFVAFVLSLSSAVFATSTIDPTQPPQGQPYQSSPIRNNFQAGANDINALQTCNFGTLAPPAPQSGYCWVNTSAAPTWTYNFYDAVTAKWVPVFNFDSVNSLLEPPIGGGLPGTLASAATTDLCAVPQATLNVTGTTMITAFGSTCPAGTVKLLTFNGALTLQYNASSLILPGLANITTAVGDSLLATALGLGSWKVLFYQSATAAPATSLAPLNSPAFTGIPTAPTAAMGTNTTQLATTAFVQTSIPIQLQANQTLNVATTGADTGNCVTASCLTIQYACNQAANNYDLNGKQVTIQVATGTYTGGCILNGPLRGLTSVFNLTIQGSIVAPDNVALTCSTVCFQVSGAAGFLVQGMKLTGANGLAAYTAGEIAFNSIDFGAFSGNQIYDDGGFIIPTGNYQITGGGLSHILVNYGQVYLSTGSSITISCVGSPAFSTAFVDVTLPGTVTYPTGSVAFSGCSGVTGPRYLVALNGVIFTNGGGATFFPGNSGGTTATGGQYN